MLKARNVTVGFLIITLLGVVSAHASTYTYNDKEVSKGEAMMILLKDPAAKVFKIDQVIFDKDRGTLKNKPK